MRLIAPFFITISLHKAPLLVEICMTLSIFEVLPPLEALFVGAVRGI